MRSTSSLIASIAAASALVLAVWIVDRGRSTDAVSARPDGHPSSSAPAVARIENALSTREPIAQPSSPASEAAPPSEAASSAVRLFGTVRGLPRVVMSGGFGPKIESFVAPDRATALDSLFAVSSTDDDGHVETASIDSDHSYSFARLHAGRWELAIDVAQCQPVRIGVDLDAAIPERRLDVDLQPRKRLQIEVTVRPATRTFGEMQNGWPITNQVVGLSIVATREPPPKLLDAAHLGNTKPIELWVSVPGAADPADAAPPLRNDERTAQTRTMLLGDPLPIYVSASAHGVVLDTQRADASTESIAFDLDGDRMIDCGGAVRLQVVGGDGGAPPADCRVVLKGPMRSVWHGGPSSSSASPDDRGAVRIDGLSAGPMTLTISADGHESIERAVTVASGEVTDLGTIALDRWCTIRGRTIDAEDHPVAVIVNAFPLERFEETRVELAKRCFKSNEDGELTIPTVGRGRYLLRVRDDRWGAAPIVVDTTNGSAQGVSIVVKPKVDVALRFEQPLPSDALVRLVDGSGLPVLESERQRGSVQRIRAVPGLYTLRVTQRGEDVLRSALFVDTKPSEVSIAGPK